MVYFCYKKLRILFFSSKGRKAPEIEKRLLKEGMLASRQGIHELTGSIGRRHGSGQKSKVTDEIKAIVDEQMRIHDEKSVFHLHRLLISKGFCVTSSKRFPTQQGPILSYWAFSKSI